MKLFFLFVSVLFFSFGILPTEVNCICASKKIPQKLVPYHTNFLLPAYYVQTPKEMFYQQQNPNIDSISHIEMKFQFSVKYPVFTNILHGNNTLYVAYSQLSYWQAYQDSAFFRESNYLPETFMRFYSDTSIFGWHCSKTDIGLIHESNGMGGVAERSWNRLFFRQKLDKGDWSLTLSVWYRMPWLASLGIHEYNANITDYMGHTSLGIKKHMGRQIFSLELRNQLDSGFAKGAEWLTWSYLLKENISVFIQAFSGYGQSLGEYDHYTNSIGIGVGFSH